MLRTMAYRIQRTGLLVLLLSAALVVIGGAACGGNDKGTDTKAARNPTDPRRVPTATVPAQLPNPVPALESGQPTRASLPESYVVKAGDTLGVIAAELGITAEALSAANPSIDPRGLRIGQELRVPRPTPTATPARPSASPAASPGRTPIATSTPARTGTATTTPARTATAVSGPSPSPSTTRTATATAAATPSGGAQTYTVVSGDTACGIARRFGVALTALAQANGQSVDAIANLRVGQTLQIPRSAGESPGC